MHQVVLDVSVELDVQLTADVANDIPNFVEVLRFIDVVILKVVQELLLILIGVVFFIFFSTKTKYFSIFFLVVR